MWVCETVFTVPSSDSFQSCCFFLCYRYQSFSFLMCLLFPVVVGSNSYCRVLGLIPLFLPFHLRWAGANFQVEWGEKIIQYWDKIFSMLYKYQSQFTLCMKNHWKSWHCVVFLVDVHFSSNCTYFMRLVPFQNVMLCLTELIKVLHQINCTDILVYLTAQPSPSV